MSLIVRLVIAFVIFGVAISFAATRIKGVRVSPRSALPTVALVFALLNTALYGLIATTIKWGSLFTLALVAPFLANAALLWLTDRLIKPFQIDGLVPLAWTAGLVTVAHLVVAIATGIVL
jgi:uncharacterized membrane protein YvlD (DUF360 family)